MLSDDQGIPDRMASSPELLVAFHGRSELTPRDQKGLGTRQQDHRREESILHALLSSMEGDENECTGGTHSVPNYRDCCVLQVLLADSKQAKEIAVRSPGGG